MVFAPPYARMRAVLNTARQQMRNEAALNQPPAPEPTPPSPLAPIPVLILKSKADPISELDPEPVLVEDRPPFPEYNRHMLNAQLIAIALQVGLDVPDKIKRNDLLALLDEMKGAWSCP